MDTFTKVLLACAVVVALTLLVCFLVFVTVETYLYVVKALAGM